MLKAKDYILPQVNCDINSLVCNFVPIEIFTESVNILLDNHNLFSISCEKLSSLRECKKLWSADKDENDQEVKKLLAEGANVHYIGTAVSKQLIFMHMHI